MHGMSSPIIKIARPGKDVRGLDDKDFSLNTEYMLPKIYRQETVTSDVDLTNELGYPHGSWAFRKLTSSSYYRKNNEAVSPFDYDNWFAGSIYSNIFAGEYTYFNSASTEDGVVTNGAIVDASKIKIKIPSGDTSISVVLFAESLTSTSNDIDLPRKPSISIGTNGKGLEKTSISDQRLNSKLDTLKIFKTGTLTLSLPGETISYKGDSVAHVAELTHGLGYPPMYFPPTAVSSGFVGGESTDVYVDSNKLYYRVIRCSYGDSAFGDPGGDRTYSASTRTFDYTIFYNDITEEFNLL